MTEQHVATERSVTAPRGTLRLRTPAYVVRGLRGILRGALAFFAVFASARADTVPLFTTQPASQSLHIGDQLYIQTGITGAASYTFLWYRNGNPLNSQQQGALLINSVEPGDAGSYSLMVTDQAGATMSSPATVTVLPDPAPSGPFENGYNANAVVGSQVTLYAQASAQGPASVQWFKDGQSLPGSISAQDLTVSNVAPSDEGTYVPVLGNSSGNFSLSPTNLRVRPPSIPNIWLDAGTQGGIAYFLFASPAAVMRYDMNAQAWLPPANLATTPTAIAVLPEGVYIAFGRTTSLYSLDLTTSQALVNTTTSTSEIFYTNAFVYLCGTSDFGEGSYTSLTRSTGALAATSTADGYSPITASPATNMAFGWNTNYSPINMGALKLNADGTVANAAISYSPYEPTYGYSRLVISPDGSKVVAETGGAYDASTLNFVASLGPPITDVCFLADGGVAALRYGRLSLYSSNFVEKGGVSMAQPAERIFTNGTNIFAFTAPSAQGGTPIAALYTESQLAASPRQPFASLSPGASAALNFSPDESFLGANGVVYLLSRPTGNILKWDPAQGSYLGSIPLTGIPLVMSYSSTLNRIYLLYGDRRITKIDLGTSQAESPFAVTENDGQSILAADDQLYVVTSGQTGAWEFLLGSDGIVTATASFSFPDPFSSWDSPMHLIVGQNGSAGVLFSVQGGAFGNGVNTPFYPDPAILDPFRFSADGTEMVSGNGVVYSTANFAQIGVLGSALTDATWIGTSVFSLAGNSTGSELDIWGAQSFLNQGKAQLNGAPLRLWTLPSGKLLAMTETRAGPVFTTFDTLANQVSQQLPGGTLAGPPEITQEPLDAIVDAGATVNLTVAATGTNVTYSWLNSSYTVVGTGPTLSFPNATYAAQGSYSAAATANGVTVMSDEASVIVRSQPVFTNQPQSVTLFTGQAIDLFATAQGYPLPSYQWYFDGIAIPGATSPNYVLYSAQASNSGTYTVNATNTVGTTTSASANVTITVPPSGAPSITTQPGAETVFAGASVTFTSAATGSPSPTYQWEFDGSPIPGATSSSYSIASAQASNEGNYAVVATNSVGSVTSNTAVLTVVAAIAPTIITQPDAQAVGIGGQVTFSVGASGSAPLSYQWSFNGSTIAGAVSGSFAIASAGTGDAGNYTVTVTNSAGSATSSSAALTVSTATVPTITTAPASQTATVGSNVSFTVIATSGVPLSYQWSFNGSPIAGANGSVFSLTNVKVPDSGSYTVAVSGSGTTTLETGAVLAVAAASGAPAIQSQPQSATVQAGGTVTFVVASNETLGESTSVTRATSSVTYQWYFNGFAIQGASSAMLLMRNVAAVDAGSYSCLVTNSSGSSLSNSATLSVALSSNPSRLINISCRSQVGTGNNILIAGFEISGAGSSKSLPVLIRSSGPALVPLSVQGTLPDPMLQLYSAASDNNLLASNSGWNGDSNIAATSNAVGAFPWTSTSSHDSALDEALLPGGYTAETLGVSGDTGVALTEVYDATPSGVYVPGSSPRLINISARVQVGSGANVLIAGFVIGGSTSETVLIRASGPALAPFNVPGTLPDPKLELHSNAAGNPILATDIGWAGDPQIASVASNVGAFNWSDTASKDSAILVTLPPGGYTAIVSGASGDTGVALVEVYEVP